MLGRSSRIICQRVVASSAATVHKNSSSATAASFNKCIPVSWLDLRGSGLSVLERLLLEECLLRHDTENRNWILVGHHEPTRHRYLQQPKKPVVQQRQETTFQTSTDDDANNPSAVIVMGIGGKPSRLLHLDAVRRENVLTLKRFSGGGTVVLDFDSIWTSIIGRKRDFVSVEAFPRPIMEWSALTVFGPLFQKLRDEQVQRGGRSRPVPRNNNSNIMKKLDNLAEGKRKQTLVPDTMSCGFEVTGRMVTIPETNDNQRCSSTPDDFFDFDDIPEFALRENDYVLGERKMGGNAQAIVGSGWLHHTSFLWDYQYENMQYLTLPEKRPDYRKDKSHMDFLVALCQHYPDLTKKDFYMFLKQVCAQQFDLQTATLPEAMDIVNRIGGMQAWFEKGGRTKIVHDLTTAAS